MSQAVANELLQVGPGGWVAIRRFQGRPDALLQPVTCVRLADVDGRLVIVELYMGYPEAKGAVDSHHLRDVRLGAVEAWANTPAIAGQIRRGMAEKGVPNLGKAVLQVMAGAQKTQQFKREPLDRSLLRLDVPGARPYGDDFYRAVAAAHRECVRAGVRGPAGEIADVNHVQLTQVHRWLREARRRKLLEPSRVGKM